MDIKTDTFHFTFDLINTYKFALVFFSYSFIFVANRYLLTYLLTWAKFLEVLQKTQNLLAFDYLFSV